MVRSLKNSCMTLAALAVVTGPVGAHANTRAADSRTQYTVASSTQIAAFPYSAWLVDEDDYRSAAWRWVAAGAGGFLLLAALIAGGSDRRPDNRSNGAN